MEKNKKLCARCNQYLPTHPRCAYCGVLLHDESFFDEDETERISLIGSDGVHCEDCLANEYHLGAPMI